MGNLDGLNRRLEKLEGRHSSGHVTWRLENGTEVSFTQQQMLAAMFSLMDRLYLAWAEPGEDLAPLPEPATALLAASEEERARIAQRLPWTADLESFYLEYATNPPDEALEMSGNLRGDDGGEVIT